MNKFVNILFLFLIVPSLFANSGEVTISGQVQNKSANSISISSLNNRDLMDAELDSEGKFKMKATVEDGYYLLNYGRNTAYVYLYPEDNLFIFFDAKFFENTLNFEGVGSERNNYLARKAEKDSELTKDLEAFYKVDETKYLSNIKNVKNTHLNALSTYDVETFFIDDETKSLEYERLLSIQNYESNYTFYLGDDIEASRGFYKAVEVLNTNNKVDYRKQPYYRYLVNSIWSKRIDDASNVNEMLKVLRRVPSQEVAISLVNGFYSKISSKNERSKDYLELIKKVTSHKPFIEAAEKRYQEVKSSKGLAVGNTSPGFSYESVDGKIVNLSDFKGKYIYIDVWATWCAPCIKQIPYLKELEKRYHNKNIAFVSISVDKAEVKETWKQMIKDRQLGGVQLFSDKSFDSDFLNTYAVNSIPRFIIIDPDGKVLEAEGPRPSYDKTKVLLDELLD